MTETPISLAEIRNYRRVISEFPIPHDRPRDVTESWVALVEAVGAAQAVDDLIPTLAAFYTDAEFHAAAYVLHECLSRFVSEQPPNGGNSSETTP